MKKIRIPFFHQQNSADCGPACLRMIAKYYGRQYSLEMLREHSFISREGVSMLGISDAAEYLGMHTLGVKVTFEQLANEAMLPCILHWNQNHFVVCYGIKGKSTTYTFLGIYHWFANYLQTVLVHKSKMRTKCVLNITCV